MSAAQQPTTPHASAPLSSELKNKAAQLFKVMSDPTRLGLLYLVAESPEGRLCCADLSNALKISAPTVTHHMKKLESVGLVRRNKEGKWAFYEVNDSEFNRVDRLINAL
ncbi:metalloregulator ArsR/SmtB family transcription factor [Corynebacterium sp. SCR221107]|nr:metalloregulator ArsR/SmtB family transcription factor [Corynebacterium sp. SCR221107]WBT09112.1 metalloregulator ArsR/SmtB family transcription factor [Corynebacterium sp. SCR221107]